MVKDHSDSERGNLLLPHGFLLLAARVLLYAPSHRQDSTYHGLCCTSHGALAEPFIDTIKHSFIISYYINYISSSTVLKSEMLKSHKNLLKILLVYDHNQFYIVKSFGRATISR